MAKIWQDIAIENMAAADTTYYKIITKIERAADNPGIGSPRPEFGDGARILVEGNYKVVYVPDNDGIRVTAIVHSRRLPSNWL